MQIRDFRSIIYNMEQTEYTNEISIEEQAVEKREREQFLKMTQTPVAKLIVMLGIPTMLNMMVTSLYNLADTYFVSGLGGRATGAVNVVLSLMSIIQAIGFTFGMGAGAIVSTLLGARKQKEADTVASSSFFIAGGIGVLIMTFGLLFLTPLLKLLGAPVESGAGMTTLAYARQYSIYILLSAPVMCMSFVMNNLLRAQGKAFLSMVGLVAGTVVNLVLDPLFIYTFGWGMRGAAIATALGQFVSFIILLVIFLSGKSIARLKFNRISKKFSVYRDVIVTGLPSFCRQILASLCTVLLNWAVKPYDGGLAALGVVQKVFMFAFSISLGIGQGYQPVLGYNHSAKRYDRVRQGYIFTLLFATALMTAFAGLCAIFAPNIMNAFLEDEAGAVEIGVVALRLQCICMPLLGVNFMAAVSYQVVGNKGIAVLLSLSRQGLFYVPAVLILPGLIGLLGVQSAQAVSDFCACLFAIPFTVTFFRDLRRLQNAERIENENVETDNKPQQ